jgi:hypothetical protein
VKKWRVGLCYSGYAWREVEAETESEAWDKAYKIVDSESLAVADWERWEDCDMVEPIEE